MSKWIEVSENLDANKNVFTSFMSASANLLTIIIIAWGAVLAVDGEISVGAFIGANILAGRAISPIIRLVQSLEPIHRSTIALQMSLIGFYHFMRTVTRIRNKRI